MEDWQARQDDALAKIYRSIAIIETALGILESAPRLEPQRIRDAAEQARFDAELARDAALGSRADWPEGEPD
jgi:hypothetical protein